MGGGFAYGSMSQAANVARRGIVRKPIPPIDTKTAVARLGTNVRFVRQNALIVYQKLVGRGLVSGAIRG